MNIAPSLGVLYLPDSLLMGQEETVQPRDPCIREPSGIIPAYQAVKGRRMAWAVPVASANYRLLGPDPVGTCPAIRLTLDPVTKLKPELIPQS